MKRIYIIVLFVLFAFVAQAQSVLPKFLIGSYGSSVDPSRISVLYKSYKWEEDLGFNFRYTQLGVVGSHSLVNYSGISQDPNKTNFGLFDALSYVHLARLGTSSVSIYKAIKDSIIYGGYNTFLQWFDYPYYYSGAHAIYFEPTNIFVKPVIMQLTQKGSTNTWETGTATDTIFKMPFYQESHLKSSGQYKSEDVANYHLNMYIRGTENSIAFDNANPALTINILVSNDNGTESIFSKVLKNNELNNYGIGKIDQYYTLGNTNIHKGVYESFIKNGIQPNATPKPVKTTISLVKHSAIKIEIDTFRVTDKDIWDKNFLSSDQYDYCKTKIADYKTDLQSQPNGATFTNNGIRFYHAVDEPHSIDSYMPLKYVNNMFREIYPNKEKRLFVHFYPGYDGYRDNMNTLENYCKNALPDPLVYYAYFSGVTYDQKQLEVKYKYLQLKYLLEKANYDTKTKDFYFIIDYWNALVNGGQWLDPTLYQARACIYSAIAAGAKGIFFEPLYSYTSSTGNVLSALVTLANSNANANDDSLNVRGKEVKNNILNLLGKGNLLFNKLSELNYLGYADVNYETLTPSISCNTTCDIFKIENNGTPSLFFNGVYCDTITQNRYLLATNMLLPTSIDSTSQADTTKKNAQKGYEIVKIDPNNPNILTKNYDLTSLINPLTKYTVSTTNPIQIGIKRGDIDFLKLSSPLLTGGTISRNDTILRNAKLTDSTLSISGNVTIYLEKGVNYTISKDIIMDNLSKFAGPGIITLQNGAKIVNPNFGNSLYRSVNAGKAQLIWSKFADSSHFLRYEIYRTKNNVTSKIATISNLNNTTYTDNTTPVSVTYPNGTDVIATYFITVVYNNIINGNVGIATMSSNTIDYYWLWLPGGDGLAKTALVSSEDVKNDELIGAFPNPAKESIKIRFGVKEPGEVNLQVYDLLGNECKTMAMPVPMQGIYDRTIDVSNLANGVYIYQIRKGKFVKNNKFVVIR